MNDIVTIVSNLGFPIACVIGLAKYIKYVTENHKSEIIDMRNSYENTYKELKKSLDKNTCAIIELVNYMKGRIDHE